VTIQKTRLNKDDRRAPVRARGSSSRSCTCGQQLDVSTRAHCPRCGRTLHR